MVKRKWSGGGGSWALSQDKKADFQEGGMINHQMNPVKEREAPGKGWGFVVREQHC